MNADNFQSSLIYFYLGSKEEETSWCVKSKHDLILFVILSKVGACLANSLMFLFHYLYAAIRFILFLSLSFQADKISRNQEFWLPTVSFHAALMNF